MLLVVTVMLRVVTVMPVMLGFVNATFRCGTLTTPHFLELLKGPKLIVLFDGRPLEDDGTLLMDRRHSY